MSPAYPTFWQLVDETFWDYLLATKGQRFVEGLVDAFRRDGIDSVESFYMNPGLLRSADDSETMFAIGEAFAAAFERASQEICALKRKMDDLQRQVFRLETIVARKSKQVK